MVMHPLARDLDEVLACTEPLWTDFRNSRLFITGGTGFFGCWLLETFVWACDRLDIGAQAVVLSRRPDEFARKAPHLARHRAIRLHEGDVRSFVPPDGSFSHIVHAATDASAALIDQEPLLMLDTIVEGTRRVLDFARDRGVSKILLTSSGAVYGRQPPELLHTPESYQGGPDPCAHGSAYAEGKRVAEQLCAIYAKQYRLEPKIARCFAFVGPYLPLGIHYAIGNFIRDGLRGGPIVVKGDGTPYRSYLYAAEMTAWLWTILVRGDPCIPYNVGSEEEVSIGELAQRVGGAFSPPVPAQILAKPVQGRPAERYVPSVERAKARLGLMPTIGLDEAIRRTISWARETQSTAA